MAHCIDSHLLHIVIGFKDLTKVWENKNKKPDVGCTCAVGSSWFRQLEQYSLEKNRKKAPD